jgi:flagellin-like hook-associated protein FlgL
MKHMSGITLTATQTQTLRSLSSASELFQTTQNELNTGKKVNSATDDAVAFFRSKSLYDRSNNILTRKANVDQSIQSVQAALTATSAVDGLLKQLKGVLEGARGASLSARVSATAQFKDIGKQLGQLVKDASYQGLNLLTSTSANLSTQFSERTAATFKINGYNLTATGAGNGRSLFTGVTGLYSTTGVINFSNVVSSQVNGAGSVKGFSALDLTGTAAGQGTVKASNAATIFSNSNNRIDAAINQNSALTAALGTNVAILQARSTFSNNYASTLSGGGDKLTLADLNTEAANSQALTLRQQIGVQSLSVIGNQNSSILSLLR